MGDPQCYRFAARTQRHSGEYVLQAGWAHYTSGLRAPAGAAKKVKLVTEIAKTHAPEGWQVFYVYLIRTLPDGAAARWLVEEFEVALTPSVIPIKDHHVCPAPSATAPTRS